MTRFGRRTADSVSDIVSESEKLAVKKLLVNVLVAVSGTVNVLEEDSVCELVHDRDHVEDNETEEDKDKDDVTVMDMDEVAVAVGGGVMVVVLEGLSVAAVCDVDFVASERDWVTVYE